MSEEEAEEVALAIDKPILASMPCFLPCLDITSYHGLYHMQSPPSDTPLIPSKYVFSFRSSYSHIPRSVVAGFFLVLYHNTAILLALGVLVARSACSA